MAQLSTTLTLDDYCVKKVQIASSFAKFDISIRQVSAEELAALDATAKTFVLQFESKTISHHVDILKLIASLDSTKCLSGDESDSSVVNHWLDFSIQRFEVPLQSYLAANSGTPEFIVPDKSIIESQVKSDLAACLEQLETQLTAQTFVATERLTIGDISLFSAISAALTLKLIDISRFSSVSRWFSTLGRHPLIHPVFPDCLQSLAPKTSTPVPVWNRSRIRIKELMLKGSAAIDSIVTCKGWVRTSRSAERNQTLFVELNDGSSPLSLQLVLNIATTEGFEAVVNSGGVHACLSVTGQVVASPAKGQTIELRVSSAQVLGAVHGGDGGTIGGKNYPMAKKAHSLEFLREIAHLRPRSKVFSSALRIRHAMAFATHKFFNDRGFVYVHTPLITAADCEGAGEQFAVTTLLPDKAKLADVPVDKKGNIDFSKDFFGRRCCLTVSGQLNVETHACALGDVYTFGPTFRAEDSHTSRHLAEFWMIEPEICFADLSDDMALAEDYVRYCASYALEHCLDDLLYFQNEYPLGEKGLVDRLRNVVESNFARITYTEMIELLQQHIGEGKVNFEHYPQWGDDLGSEHERYVCEKVYQKPTIVINYPKGIKAFYMKLNDDNETVAAMDILVPKIGELIGGSQREERFDVLAARCAEMGLSMNDIWWYGDLRKYGTAPHAGFGLGFERLVMFVTGLENIRDVIPFPRYPGHAEF